MKSQLDTILHAMQTHPDRLWKAKDFQHGENFVWYEAPTRIGDLCRLWLAQRVGFEGKFAQYQITASWKSVKTARWEAEKEKAMITGI